MCDYSCLYVHSVVDLSHNRLEDLAVQHVFTAMPELVNIIIQGVVGCRFDL